MPVSVLDHPVAGFYLCRLRDKDTASSEFRRCLNALAGMLMFEATRSLATRSIEIETPLCRTSGSQLRQTVGLVPILRAGLCMMHAASALLPEAPVWHLGLYRDEATASPVHYYSKLPADRPVDVAFVLDPMLATGGSALAALEALNDWGVRQVHIVSIIAAVPGVERVQSAFPDAAIHTAALDPTLNDRKFIVPGLGDAGDRAFGTA